MGKSSAKANNAGPSGALTAIRLSGFKCFRDPVDVAIRPLTLLAGANSGGKSSLMQPLLLIKQTLEATFDPGPLLLDGPLVKLEVAATLAWRGPGAQDRAARFWVETEGAQHHVRSTFGVGGRRPGVQLESTEYKKPPIEVKLPLNDESRNALLQSVAGKDAGDFDAKDSRSRSFYHVVVGKKSYFNLSPIESSEISGLTSGYPDRLGIFHRLLHLPGLRGNPERAYPRTHASERFPGPFPVYSAGLLLGWKEAKDPRLAHIGEDLHTLGLSWKVDPRPRGDTAIEVQIGRLPGPAKGGAADLVNIADVGLGVSQVLPVVVALQAAAPDQIVHIEQPELHLHPRAQAAMADLLIAAANRGVIVIVESHSGVMLRAVQRRVAEGAIRASDVALHWFERDDDGAAHVRTADLDRTGAYGDWPVDFDDVEMEVDRAYINAAFGEAGS